MRTHKHQPKAKRDRGATVKWNLDDKLNVSKSTDLQVLSARESVNLVTHTNFTALGLYVLQKLTLDQ